MGGKTVKKVPWACRPCVYASIAEHNKKGMGPITAAQLLKGKLKQELCIPGQNANGVIGECRCGHEKKEHQFCAYTNLASTIRKMQTTPKPQGSLPNKKAGC